MPTSLEMLGQEGSSVHKTEEIERQLTFQPRSLKREGRLTIGLGHALPALPRGALQT